MRVIICNPWGSRAYDGGVGKKVDVEDLVGAAEIAQRLGVKRPHLIHDWRRRYSEFPKPVVQLKGTLVWDWRDIECWARATGRLE